MRFFIYFILSLIITACGNEANLSEGAVKVEVNKPVSSPAPKDDRGEANEPVGESEDVTPSEDLGDVDDSQPLPTVSPAPTLGYDPDMVALKQAHWDARLLARFESLSTWELGDNWTAKSDRMDYSYTPPKDYLTAELGAFNTDEDQSWINWVNYHNGHRPKRICGSGFVPQTNYTDLTISYKDLATTKLEIEVTFDERDYHVKGDPLYIMYLKLTYKASTDAEPTVIIKSACGT